MAFNTTVALYLIGESGKLNDSTENLSEVQKGWGVTPHHLTKSLKNIISKSSRDGFPSLSHHRACRSAHGGSINF
nr:hypothetical protein [Globicatella sanguinis]